MRGSGLAVGSATRSRSWAERLESVLEQDQDTLTLPRMWAADLLAVYRALGRLVAAGREVVAGQRAA